jgi:phosphoribosylanthranilate isomerase
MSVFVKLCGLAREEDVLAAIGAGPDALGFVFWPKSPRAVTAEQVAAWTRGRVPPGMKKVGVFVNQDPAYIRDCARIAALDVVQLHGDEDAAFVRALGLPAWKALHLDRLPASWETLPVELYVIDSGTAEMPGGTGRRVDTARAAAFVRESPIPVLLAGGLNAANVTEALREVRPWGLDVSSGVEHAPGQKDPEALRAFVRNARAAG